MSYKLDLMRQQMRNVSSSNSHLAGDEEFLSIYEREPSKLVSLPAEILNIIAKFLSAQDLLSCSATCTRLRAVFNDNIIWKKFCKQHVMDYIEDSKQKIELKYDFYFPTNDLDEICEQRRLYMKQNRLLMNWKNGKYVEHTVHSPSGIYYTCLKSGVSIIYEDIYLFLYDFSAHNIVIWNIEDIPVRFTSVRLPYHNYFYEGLYYEIVGKKLVVLEVGKLIQIYDIKLPNKTLPLIHIILVDKNEPLHKAPEFSSPEQLYSVCYHKIFGKKVYSHKVGKPILHIWDVETGQKVKALEPPKHGCDFNLLTATEDGNDLILSLKIKDPERQHNAFGTVFEVFTYSFSRNFFRLFWTNKEDSYCAYVPFHALHHMTLVILFCRVNDYFVDDPTLSKTILVFYDYKWAMIVGEKSFPEMVCYRQTKVVNDQLLLATAFCVYILNVNTQEFMYSFRYDNGKIELLDVFDFNFIITTPQSLLSISRTKRKEVWDIKKRRCCMSITYVFKGYHSKDSVFINKSFTKMVVVGKGTIGVLHFW